MLGFKILGLNRPTIEIPLQQVTAPLTAKLRLRLGFYALGN